MAQTSPHQVVLSDQQRRELERRAAAYSGSYRDVVRAKAILLAAEGAAAENLERDRPTRRAVRGDLFTLFSEQNAQVRGKRLESVLNRLFALDGLGIHEAFHVVGDEGQGIVEQIDGAIELDGEIDLVEMKWLQQPVGVQEISPHLVRLFSRAEARGIFISQSRFTGAAIAQSKQALAQKVSVLCELEEVVRVLERETDIAAYLRDKVRAAITERRPLHRPVIA